MAYSQSGKIQASDINNIVATVNTTLTNLGQPTLASVSVGNKILASDWATLNQKITTIATHQGTVISTLPSISAGQRANYYATLTSASSAINNLNASAQGTTVYNKTSVATGWYDNIVFTQSVAFANATAATNYFNAGGQLALRMIHPAAASGIDAIFNALGTACGTLVMSGQNSGTRTIAGTSYTGFQRVGGSGTPTTNATNLGYAGLTATKQILFKQVGGTYTNPAPGGGTYSQNFVQVSAYTTTNGATINFETIWDEVPNGLVTGAGSVAGPDGATLTRTTTYVIFRPPATTNITNSWGTLTFAGSVAGT
jgi:hypothetical protein